MMLYRANGNVMSGNQNVQGDMRMFTAMFALSKGGDNI